MKKSITLVLVIFLAISKSYSCDSCFIKMNKKYILKSDSLIVSLTFINDSAYVLRGEKAQDRWVSYGKWDKVSNKSVFMRPNKGGLKIDAEHEGRIWKIDRSYIFELKDEKIEIKCIKGKANILIDSYIFR